MFITIATIPIKGGGSKYIKAICITGAAANGLHRFLRASQRKGPRAFHPLHHSPALKVEGCRTVVTTQQVSPLSAAIACVVVGGPAAPPDVSHQLPTPLLHLFRLRWCQQCLDLLCETRQKEGKRLCGGPALNRSWWLAQSMWHKCENVELICPLLPILAMLSMSGKRSLTTCFSKLLPEVVSIKTSIGLEGDVALEINLIYIKKTSVKK